MQIQILKRFKLIQKDEPQIVSRVVVKDANVGGIKLRYEVSTVKALVFSVFKRPKTIVLRTLPKTLETRTFLRPFKKSWNASRDRLPKSLWGKNNEPLTNLWIELECDYKDLSSGMVIIKQEVRNTHITKHFTRHKEEFFINLKSFNV